MNESVLYYLNKGQYEDAINLHEEDLAEFGEAEGNGKYYFLLATAYQELGAFSKAIKVYAQVLDYYANAFNEYHNLTYLNLVTLESEFRHLNNVHNYVKKIKPEEIIYPKNTFPDKLLPPIINECYHSLIKISYRSENNIDNPQEREIFFIRNFLGALYLISIKGYQEAEELLIEVISKINDSKQKFSIQNTYKKFLIRLYREWYQNCNDMETIDSLILKRKILFDELLAEYYPETGNQMVEELTEIKQYWAYSMNIDPFDEELIISFFGRYNLAWIIKALNLAFKKNIGNFGKYAATILKNWSENGFPDAGKLPKLPDKLATENQIRYVRDLLIKNNLTLDRFCERKDLSELTMQDANKIISTITRKV